MEEGVSSRSAAGRGRDGGAQWCSLFNITSHSNQTCRKQKITGNTGSASLVNVDSPHQPESPVKTAVETKPEVTGGYMGGNSFMARTSTEPAPQERSTEAREKELSGSETLGLFGSLGEGPRIGRPNGHGKGVREKRRFRQHRKFCEAAGEQRST